MSNDRIERTRVLAAPRSRVWRALTDAQEFSSWFGVKLMGPFTAGARVSGPITVPGYEHVTMDITIERVEPERLFSYRWHPYAIEAGVDYSAEPTTLVEFRLEDVASGTRLTVTESGFDAIPLARRAKAFQMNDNGWAQQVENLARHVSA
jgi:uncharacterized protein YndB with AHSA1/START domain